MYINMAVRPGKRIPAEDHLFFSLLASSSFMALNLSLPILALKAQMIEIANITIGRVQKIILTASCAV